MKKQEFAEKLQNFASELNDEVFEIYYTQIILGEFDFNSEEPVIMFGKHFGTFKEMNRLTFEETFIYLEETEQYEKMAKLIKFKTW